MKATSGSISGGGFVYAARDGDRASDEVEGLLGRLSMGRPDGFADLFVLLSCSARRCWSTTAIVGDDLGIPVAVRLLLRVLLWM